MTSLHGRYASWIRRAESFVRRLNYLPGQWGISVAIEDPITTSQADELDKELPFGLPAPLRELYTEGAGRCKCNYRWKPNEEHLHLVRDVFEHELSFNGGPEFLPWTELLEAHGMHDWWGGYDDSPPGIEAAALNVWRHSVPFISVGNGDHVALHVTDDARSMPVVYLCHDDSDNPVTRISSSFDQFLSDWEKLCYVGPEIWLLSTFLSDGAQGELNVEQEKSRKWREVMLGK